MTTTLLLVAIVLLVVGDIISQFVTRSNVKMLRKETNHRLSELVEAQHLVGVGEGIAQERASQSAGRRELEESL